MARIRTIKPSFWEDEKIAKLPMPCRLFYIGTWNLADDSGVIRGNPALLKSAIFPYDDNLRVSEVQRWIDALVNARMLIPISHKHESYYVIRTFRSHQKLDPRYPNYIISKEAIANILDSYDNTSGTQCAPSGDPLRDGGRDLYRDIYPPIVPQGGNTCNSQNEIPNNYSKFSEEEKEKSSAKKEKELNYSFDEFWELYDKKVGKKDELIKKWLKLSEEERELAMSYIPEYKLSKPNKKYRKNPETFLNQKAWNDELIFDDQANGNTTKQKRTPCDKESDFD